MSWKNVGTIFRFTSWFSCNYSIYLSSIYEYRLLIKLLSVGPHGRKFKVDERWIQSSLSWMYQSCLWFCQRRAIKSRKREGVHTFCVLLTTASAFNLWCKVPFLMIFLYVITSMTWWENWGQSNTIFFLIRYGLLTNELIRIVTQSLFICY